MRNSIKLYLVLLFFWLLNLGCSNSENLAKPRFVKVYLGEASSDNNLYVLDAFPEENNEITLFAIMGNLSNKFERAKSWRIARIDAAGKLLWVQNFPDELQDINYGFPTNILPTTTGYQFLWSDYENIIQIKLNTKEIQGYDVAYTVLNSESNVIPDGTAYYITPSIDNQSLLTFNYTKSDEKIYINILDVTDSKLYYQGQYISPYSDLFPNIDLIDPMVSQEYNFWLDTFNGRYFITTPHSNCYALFSVGSNTPIYSDTNYWITSHTFVSATSMAGVIVPHNLPDAEGNLYFAPSIQLSKINQQFNDLKNTVQVNELSKSHKIIILPWNGVFIVGGTTKSGATIVYTISTTGQVLHTETFGSGSSYTLRAMRILSDNQTLALIGNTTVNNFYQRAYYVQIPISELQ